MKRIDPRRVLAILMLPLVLVLTSCARCTADVDIRSDHDVRLSLDLSVDKSVAESARVNTATLCRQFQPGSRGLPTNATVTSYTEGRFVGCRISFQGDIASLGPDVLKHDRDRWTFALRADPRLIRGVPMDVTPQQIDEFHFAVTFPGRVMTHSGSSQVKGKTVTWTDPRDLFSPDGLQATAEDGPNWPFLLGVGVGLLAGLAAAGLIALLLTRSAWRNQQAQTLVDDAWVRHQQDARRAEDVRAYYAQPVSSLNPPDSFPTAGAHVADRPDGADDQR